MTDLTTFRYHIRDTFNNDYILELWETYLASTTAQRSRADLLKTRLEQITEGAIIRYDFGTTVLPSPMPTPPVGSSNALVIEFQFLTNGGLYFEVLVPSPRMGDIDISQGDVVNLAANPAKRWSDTLIALTKSPYDADSFSAVKATVQGQTL